MPGVVREGDLDSGHGPWPPRPAVQGSTTVFCDHLPIVRLADLWAPHTETERPYETHSGVSATASPTVFCEGKAVCFVGCLVSCGSTMVNGSPDVNVNG
jgi:uncharacterized Zn-binding protein involved in type VI secretion